MSDFEVEVFITAAKEHSLLGEPQHEVEDLRNLLRVAFGLLSQNRPTLFLEDARVLSAMIASSGHQAAKHATPLDIYRALTKSNSQLDEIDIQALIESTKRHGDRDGAAYEIGDLQEYFCAAFELLTRDDKFKFLDDTNVQNVLIEAGLALFEGNDTPVRMYNRVAVALDEEPVDEEAPIVAQTALSFTSV